MSLKRSQIASQPVSGYDDQQYHRANRTAEQAKSLSFRQDQVEATIDD
ncbi:MAG: hypothetical protein RLP02_12915 [Coleofasciculus sp. C2-GNP5-27]